MRRKACLGAVLGLVVATGCAAGNDQGTGGTSSPTGGGGAGGTVVVGGSGGLGGGFNTGGSGGSGRGCSGDLKYVVDGVGAVIETCTPDLACANGECVPVCEGAAASLGSIGCEFLLPRPEFRTISNCFTGFVVNTWDRPAILSVSRDGTTYDVSAIGRIPNGFGASVGYSTIPPSGLPPGEVAVLFLGGSCSTTPAVPGEWLLQASGRNQAFEIVSDTPVKLYDLVPYGSGGTAYLPSASLIYPRTAWDSNYVAVVPHWDSYGEQWLMIVGTTDGTTVQVKPPVLLPAGTGVSAAPAGEITSYTLGAGEVLQWYEADATGTIIGADHPIGAFAGNVYLGVDTVTSGPGGRDAAHQQLPHVKALGHEYVGASVVSRLVGQAPESVLYRIMGVVDGTQLSYEPSVPGAPTTLALGQAVEFETTELFVVRSQGEEHPFSFSQYMSGTIPSGTVPDCTPGPNNPNNESCGLGDEEWVMTLPTEQYLRRYVFFIDPTYATTNVVITRLKGETDFADVEISCLGTVTGWQAADTAGDVEVAHVDLVRGGVGATAACETTVHEVTSDGRFGITVWGTDLTASYAYPAGGSFGSVNDVYVPPVLE